MIVEREESAAATVAAMATTSTSGISDFSQYPVYSLPIEGCTYRGEGNANLVVALPSERMVIRLRKWSGEESRRQEKKEEEKDEAQVRRQVDFIRGVISAFLGTYVCAPEILLCDQAEIARLSDKIRAARPKNRRNKEIVGGYATKFPDFTFLPQHLSSFSSKPTFCVEIKPKQGYLCKPDRQFEKCPYCLMQYYKTRKGSIREPSAYCPFDLFSGQSERMDRALLALLNSPQNNFKIFKDGAVIYDERLAIEDEPQRILADWFASDDSRVCLQRFFELVKSALTRGFDAGRQFDVPEILEFKELRGGEVPCRLKPELVERVKMLLSLDNKECELGGEDLTDGSVLERILRMQKLHNCGADLVTWLYSNFSEILSDELIYADLDDDDDDDGNNSSSYTSVPCKNLSEWIIQDGDSQRNPNATSKSRKENKNGDSQKQIVCDKIINDVFLKNVTAESCFNILKNYLLFCTAKDCSISMAFQEVDKELPASVNSIHRIDLSKDQSFLVNVRVLDLDMKNVHCIEKHRLRDKDILEATVNELEKKINRVVASFVEQFPW